MDHQTTTIVSRTGVLGGTLTSLFFTIQVTNLYETMILASIGAGASFCTVKLLNFLFARFHKR